MIIKYEFLSLYLINFSYSPVQSSSGQSTLVGLPALDNDDFAISLPMIPASSSVQNRISPPPLPTINTKSLSTLESDSSSSSSSSDTSSSDSETETPTQTTNGKLQIYCHNFLSLLFILNCINSFNVFDYFHFTCIPF